MSELARVRFCACCFWDFPRHLSWLERTALRQNERRRVAGHLDGPKEVMAVCLWKTGCHLVRTVERWHHHQMFFSLTPRDGRPAGYLGPIFRTEETVIVVFRSRLKVNTLGLLAPVVDMAVIARDGLNSNGNAGGVDFGGELFANGMEEYLRQGDLEEDFDIDMRNRATDGKRAHAAGYMMLGHWSMPWGVYIQFRGAIHHMEMHNATLTDDQVNDVIARLRPLMNSTAPQSEPCSDCPRGRNDHDADPDTPCVDCAPGRFQAAAGATVCGGTCAAGQTILAFGSTSAADCVACSVGTYGAIIEGTALCLPCAQGTSSNTVGATSVDTCVACGPGMYSPTGSTECHPAGCTDDQADNNHDAAHVSVRNCVYTCSNLFALAGGLGAADGVCVIFETSQQFPLGAWNRYLADDTAVLEGRFEEVAAGAHYIIQGRLVPGSTVTDPVYEQYPGYVQAIEAHLTLRYLTMENAQSQRVLGAAVYAGDGTSNYNLVIDHVHLNRNEAYSGGAVSTGHHLVASLLEVTFVGNYGEARGGAIVIDASDMTIAGGRFEANVADLKGGAISVDNGGSLVLQAVTFLSNQAPKGGAVFVGALGRVDITRSNFRENTAPGKGGAISTELATINLRDSTFVDNAAEGLGGSLHIDQPPSLKISDTNFEPFEAGGGSVFIGGQLAGCDINPCPLGFGCSYSQYSLTCTPCSTTTASLDGKACESCAPGTGPNADSTACDVCFGNTVSAYGICGICPSGFASNDAHTTCIDLSDGGLTDTAVVTEILNSSVKLMVTFGIDSSATLPGGADEQTVFSNLSSTLGIGAGAISVRTEESESDSATTFVYVTVDDSAANERVLSGFADASVTSSVVRSHLQVTTTPTFGFVCPVGLYRPEGSSDCDLCPGGTGIPDLETQSSTCRDCPQRQVPNLDSCVCGEGFYSGLGDVRCFSTGYTQIVSTETDTETDTCSACSLEKLGHPCLDSCRGSEITVSAGWQGVTQADGSVSIFACVGGSEKCLGGVGATNISNSSCAIGYTGTLCSVCSDGYHKATGSTCKSCSGMSWGGIAAIVLALLVVVAIASSVKIW